MPAPPVLTAEHRRLHALVGSWTGEETMHPSRWFEAGPATSQVSARAAADGFYVVQDYVQMRAGKVIFQAHGVFAHDGEDRTSKLFWFDSLGFVPPTPASGVWRGDTLTLLRASLRGATRHIYTLTGPDSYTMTLQFSPDHEGWADLLTGSYRRN